MLENSRLSLELHEAAVDAFNLGGTSIVNENGGVYMCQMRPIDYEELQLRSFMESETYTFKVLLRMGF